MGEWLCEGCRFAGLADALERAVDEDLEVSTYSALAWFEVGGVCVRCGADGAQRVSLVETADG